MFDLWIFGAGAAIVLLVWLTSPTFSADEPPAVAHYIPVMGHAFSLAFNKRQFLLDADRKANHQPFSMFVAGRKHYVFKETSDMATVWRNGKTLSINNFLKFLHKSLFGMSDKETDMIVEAKDAVHSINTNFLLNTERNKVTATRYFVKLEDQLRILDDKLAASKTQSLTLDAFQLTASLQGNASVMAYFGEDVIAQSPDLLDDLEIYVRYGFWPMLFQIPRLFLPKPYQARDRIIDVYKRLIEDVDHRKDVSPFIVERIKLWQEQGMKTSAIAKDLTAITFGLNANSIPTGYLAFLHLLSSPGLLDTVRTELITSGYTTMDQRDYITIIPSQVPHLRALWHENLRFHNTSFGFREVTAPTTLISSTRTYQLQKGSMVSMPSSLLHWNERLHPRPREFRAGRFLDAALGGEGENAAKGIKAFGGGSSYCPGRVFAEKQIIGFLAAVAQRYDLRIVNEAWSIPDYADYEHVSPWPRVFVEIRKRTV